jgi:hypothetical protein
MSASAADVALVASDMIALVEELAAEADPAERELLEQDYDLALDVLERATAMVEQERRSELCRQKLYARFEAEDLLNQPGLRRRFMTPAQKSLVLRTHGAERYWRIPW